MSDYPDFFGTSAFPKYGTAQQLTASGTILQFGEADVFSITIPCIITDFAVAVIGAVAETDANILVYLDDQNISIGTPQNFYADIGYGSKRFLWRLAQFNRPAGLYEFEHNHEITVGRSLLVHMNGSPTGDYDYAILGLYYPLT